MEIGSEFSISGLSESTFESNLNYNWISKGYKDYILLFSGRTALDYILNDIENNKSIKSAYLPSYCCDSLLAAFIERDIKLYFYEVTLNKGNSFFECKIEKNIECDILITTNYFGFYTYINTDTILYYKERNTIIISDDTHSFLSKDIMFDYVDYSFASIRKWFNVVSGGVAYKKNDFFQGKETLKNDYYPIKYKAMQLKQNFIDGDISIDKSEFMSLYKEFNDRLNLDYRFYNMDDISIRILTNQNIKDIIKKRIDNSCYIIDNLRYSKIIKFVNKEITENYVPLFVPIIINSKYRNELKVFLINHSIYCPIHWPKPNIIDSKLSPDLYNGEISIICDQRYSIDEMKYITDTINKFEKTQNI